jgi:hypothetical protein
MKRAILLVFLSLLLCLLTAVSASAGWTEPVPVQELNMSGDEFWPYLSANGQVMIFDAQGTIAMSHWNGTTWGPREYLPTPVNYVGLQRQAAITPDLHWIYWISWRAEGMGAWDIWRSSWDDSSHTCGPAECLGPNVNSPDIEWSVSFSPCGSRIYFVTDTHSKNGQIGHGSDDIWYCDWDSVQGDWGGAYNLGSLINTSDIEQSPYISLGDTILYFVCAGGHRLPGWQGGYDIFKATGNGNIWTSVENLLTPINSPTWEWGPTVTPDNINLYFCTHRNRDPNADYELMLSAWEPTGINDNVEPIDNSIKIEYYPNPFNNAIEIQVSNCNEKAAQLNIYDIKGQKVRKYDIILNNGAGMATWDSRNQQGHKVATGNYIVQIDFPNGKEIRKIITLLK